MIFVSPQGKRRGVKIWRPLLTQVTEKNKKEYIERMVRWRSGARRGAAGRGTGAGLLRVRPGPGRVLLGEGRGRTRQEKRAQLYSPACREDPWGCWGEGQSSLGNPALVVSQNPRQCGPAEPCVQTVAHLPNVCLLHPLLFSEIKMSEVKALGGIIHSG